MAAITQVYSPKQKLKGYRLFRDYWAPYLKGAKHCVLQAIYGHTVDYGKIRERITVRHLIEGLGSIAGLPYCERTIRRTLDALTKMKAILRRRTREGYEYSVNLVWNPGSISDVEDDEMGLVVPKRLKNVAPITATEEHETPSPVPVQRTRQRLPVPKQAGQNVRSEADLDTVSYKQRDTTTEDTSLSNSEAPSALASMPASLEVSEERAEEKVLPVASAISKIKEKLVDVTKKMTQRPLKEKDLFTSWKLAFHETFPDANIAPWGKREFGMAKSTLSSMSTKAQFPTSPDTRKAALPKINGSLTAKQDFLDWVVRSWSLIVSTRFYWMDKDPPPKFPSISFVCAFKERFYEAYNDRDTLRNELSLNLTEAFKKKLIAKGATAEEAQAEIDARDAYANRKDEKFNVLRELNNRLKEKAEWEKNNPRYMKPYEKAQKAVLVRPRDDWDVPEDQ